MKFGVDFHDTISWVYPLKAVQIAQDIPDWRVKFRDWYAEGLIGKVGMSREQAYKTAEERAGTLPAIPPSLIDRFYGSQIIGEKNYDKITKIVHGSPILDAPLKPGVREGLERLALEDGHEPHLVTIVREEHFPYVHKYLDMWNLSGLFAGRHRLPREQEGGEESKASYCIRNGMHALVDDELRRLRLNGYHGKEKEFLGIMVGAGISQEDADELRQDTDFVNMLSSSGIKPAEFLKMLLDIGGNGIGSAQIGSGNDRISSLGGARIIYAPRFHPDATNAIMAHAGAYN